VINIRQSLRVVLREPTLFHGYRWVAWGLAALTFVIARPSNEDLPFFVWLWIFVGVCNILTTALAESYIRIARIRPIVMGLDIVAAVSLVWISGGGPLPFLAFALGSLVLPTLLFQWRGGFIAGAFFVILDQLALWAAYLQGTSQRINTPFDALIQALVPFGFVLAFQVVYNLVCRWAARPLPETHGLANYPAGDMAASSGFYAGSGLLNDRRAPQSDDYDLAGLLGERPSIAPMATVRTHNPVIEDWRRTLIAMTASTTAGLPAALELLAAGFSARSGIRVQNEVVGETTIVARPHYATLLRLAQEALLNVQQHARAEHVFMTLVYEPDRLMLIVSDDGVGLVDGTHERPGVHALRALSYRLAEVDGTLEIIGGEHGVTVRGTVPLGEASLV
jgi:hypothetical protein